MNLHKILTISCIVGLCLGVSYANAQSADINALEKNIKLYQTSDTMRVYMLNEVAYLLYSTNLDKMYSFVIEADSLSDHLNFVKGKAESQRVLGLYYFMKSDYLTSRKYLDISLKLNQSINFKQGIAKTFNNIGNIYNYQGNYTKGFEFYQNSLEIYQELQDTAGMSRAFNNIGIIYRYTGNYAKALDSQQNSLHLKEIMNDKPGMSYSYFNIGEVYFFQEDYHKALAFFIRALNISLSLNEKSMIIQAENNIGETYQLLNDFNKALKYSQKSLEVALEFGEKSGIARAYANISTNYYHLKKYEKAIQSNNKALKIANELDSKSLIVKSYINMCRINSDLKETNKAILSGQKAYKIASLIKEKEQVKEISGILSQLYASQEQYDLAYKYQLIYKKESDSLLNKANTKKIVGLEYTYKFEKEKQLANLNQKSKDAAQLKELKYQKNIVQAFIAGSALLIILVGVVLFSFFQKRKANFKLAGQKKQIEEQNFELQSKNTEIYSQNTELQSQTVIIEQALKDKEALIQEIHHRVKNNLQSISGIVNMQIMSLKNSHDKEILQQTRSRINAMSLVHEMLYSTDNLASISLKEYLEKLLTWADKVVNTQRLPIQFISNIDDKNLDVSHCISLGMITSEAISNSIKYAFADTKNPTIIVNFTAKADNNFIFTIKDNGCGFKEQEDGTTRKSLGLRLMKIFSRQIEANLSIYNDSGTVVQLKTEKLQNK